MKEGELKIFYLVKEGEIAINVDMDAALEVVLKKFGFRRGASGFDLTSDVRDLAFEKKITK